jgi:diaminopimelate decarboxylase
MPTTVRSPYERPLITRQALGTIDKQWSGSNYPVSAETTIDGLSASEIRAQFGSPLYVVSELALRQRYRDFAAAFRSRYSETAVAYSYKTNYLSGVCAILHQEGAWAEAVSGFEMELAQSLGVPGRQIVYNGPWKPFQYLMAAARMGARINIDSLEEVYDLEEVGRQLGKPVGVGIRVNMAINDPPWDKFGFNLESGQALDICRKVQGSKHLSLVGFHLHAGTFLCQADVYNRAIHGLLDLARQVESKLGAEIEYLDLGGGYASRTTLHGQLLPGELTVPSFDEYAEAICVPLKAAARGLKRRPLLILEPGRAIVDEAVSLLVSVVSVKSMVGGKKGVVVDGGINLIPSAYYFRHEISVHRESEGPTETVDLYGPLCMQIDVIRRDVMLPPVQRGGILIIKHAGAYTVSNSMQFIYPRPASVLVSQGKVYCLRRAETTQDLIRLDEMPSHLARTHSKNGHQARGSRRSRR